MFISPLQLIIANDRSGQKSLKVRTCAFNSRDHIHNT